MKKNGLMSLTSMNEIPNTPMYCFLDGLYERKLINNYTDDGWVHVTSSKEWCPIKIACKKLGDKVYNEYLECRG
jgi:hypothetical protein